jgi:hypothetical protein
MQKAAEELAALSQQRYFPPLDIAMLYASAEKTDHALRWLEKACEYRDPGIPFLKVEPRWDDFRTDPRFTTLLKKSGLEK